MPEGKSMFLNSFTTNGSRSSLHPPKQAATISAICKVLGLVADTRVDYILMLILRSFKRKATDIRSLR